MKRRAFLKRTVASLGSVAVLGTGYGLLEAVSIRVLRQTVAVPRLPEPFAGKTVALLTDLHHGPFNSLNFIRAVVAQAKALKPDLIALGGDYVQETPIPYVHACFEVLRELSAPLGVYAVPGNHDHHRSAVRETHAAIRDSGIIDVTNAGRWIEQDGCRLRIAGVDDLWYGEPDLDAALGDTTPADTSLLLCHNPEVVETLHDRRVGLVLSGHTHGGQVHLPLLGAPWIPSRYGQKYAAGLVRTAWTQVLVSRGLGTVGLPFRLGSPPEINLLTLTTLSPLSLEGRGAQLPTL
jgi:predicted MPP superfamily phosphohydrolase